MLELEHLIICLVEPSAVQAQIIRRALAEFGISQIDVCKTGAEALATLMTAPPDVVISALYLPDMTGTDLVYRMRHEDNLMDIPYILVSSETNPRYLDPIRQAGTIAILPKPFKQTQLDKALINTLDLLNGENLHLDDAMLPLQDMVVLVVDDSLTARRHISSVLQKIGIENIHEAENGMAAIPLLESTMFDIVFTDYNMPEMDGHALTQYIRTQSMQSSVPILMVSSEEDSSRLAMVEEAGVSAICNKPFDPQTIRQLIQKMIINLMSY